MRQPMVDLSKFQAKGLETCFHDRHIDPQIYEVFVITKLNKLFEIHETAVEAMKSFK